MDHHGGDVVMYPTLLIMALCMTTLGLASTNAVFAFGGILLGLSYSTISSAGQALAIHGIPEQQIGLATSTFFIFLDLGVGIGPYLLGFLVPAYGFSSVYFSAAFIAFVSLPLYYLLIGKSGVFSYKQMNAVRHQEQNKHTTWSIQK
jgi:MFS family permease